MSKSEMKRKKIQQQWSEWEQNIVGHFVDPPTGWMYGFPAIYDGKQPLRDWIESKGYPMKDWDDWARNYVRVWKEDDQK
jgi:hypothetical protein